MLVTPFGHCITTLYLDVHKQVKNICLNWKTENLGIQPYNYDVLLIQQTKIISATISLQYDWVTYAKCPSTTLFINQTHIILSILVWVHIIIVNFLNCLSFRSKPQTWFSWRLKQDNLKRSIIHLWYKYVEL